MAAAAAAAAAAHNAHRRFQGGVGVSGLFTCRQLPALAASRVAEGPGGSAGASRAGVSRPWLGTRGRRLGLRERSCRWPGTLGKACAVPRVRESSGDKQPSGCGLGSPESARQGRAYPGFPFSSGLVSFFLVGVQAAHPTSPPPGQQPGSKLCFLPLIRLGQPICRL